MKTCFLFLQILLHAPLTTILAVTTPHARRKATKLGANASLVTGATEYVVIVSMGCLHSM